MPLVSKDEMRTYLGSIKVTDEQLIAYIEDAEEWIKEYTRRDELPKGYAKNVKKMVAYDLTNKEGKTTESLGKHSISFENSDYPKSCLRGLRKKLKVV
ncbi:small nuclear ribonucleoprotein (snRNP)-like protein [Evansella vedderi]|uniref:Small nuclear ribonucleoprotein (SnRNP)-like protein n=1 Tax=Evansella vedderi TaxID=38282 RepID=A0ABT9ZUK0_9BACI|nr:phage head-tail connector protein [Evansella vedderi]MDQ0254925.1 small nuclear ribonucleoprotein (snRNP)-like protein [Evansella vedderi]